MPIGLGLQGAWVRLEPVDDSNAAELAGLDVQRQLEPLVGATSLGSSQSIAPQMIVRDIRSNQAAGVVQNHGQPGGIAVYVVYLNPRWQRVGFGFEATVLYISHLFDSGARLVTSEVLEFNTQIIGIIRKIGLEPQARMREHVFVGGRYWDLLVYTMDEERWLGIIERYRRILPGGTRKPSAIGTRRRGTR